MEFRDQVLQKLVTNLQSMDDVFAVWEGGSAANSTTDQYSDVDISILGTEENESIFAKVKESLSSISGISHIWNEPKSIWPDLTQKVYFLKDSPKHFFVDVAVFPKNATSILSEFMQIERHGKPVIHFDKSGLIVTKSADKKALFEKHQKRLSEIVASFPVYRTEVYKELDRGNGVDAVVYFQAAMLKQLVEVLGMLHRPYHFDFGFRYLKRSFPPDVYSFVEKCSFVSDLKMLRVIAGETEELFYKSVDQVKDNILREL